MIQNRPNIYIAGPLFSPTERRWNCELRDQLDGFYEVYLHQEDGELLVKLVEGGMPIDKAKKFVFCEDISAIDRCHILLLVMDGRIIDEGACFELGYAYSLAKACVGLKTDVRSLLPIGDNPMIECALRHIFREPSDLFDWISRGGWKLS